ncbi:hypothetical protein IFM89_008787 [Coptis chinensis]|uniref:RRM domain-containing protein n=1 Tax=Coptis chinensis TaxID=261450 RepID=A0A835GYR8_9MAGN|nr:hypothetical protein IFM89_008787 [Coptis chinensis]
MPIPLPSSRPSRISHGFYRCARGFVFDPSFDPYMLPEPTLCQYCGAKQFIHETSEICCGKGRISEEDHDDDHDDTEEEEESDRNISRFEDSNPPNNSILPSTFDAFSEVSGPPGFLNNSVAEHVLAEDVVDQRGGRRGGHKYHREKQDLSADIANSVFYWTHKKDMDHMGSISQLEKPQRIPNLYKHPILSSLKEPRGFGFVPYVDPDDAAKANYQMDGQVLHGREQTVVFAEETRKKPAEMRARERQSTNVAEVKLNREDVERIKVRYERS